MANARRRLGHISAILVVIGAAVALQRIYSASLLPDDPEARAVKARAAIGSTARRDTAGAQKLKITINGKTVEIPEGQSFSSADFPNDTAAKRTASRKPARARKQ